MAKKEFKGASVKIGDKTQQLINAINKRITKKVQKIIDFMLIGYPVKALLSINVQGKSFCRSGKGVQTIVVGLTQQWVDMFSIWVLEYIVIPYLAEHETDHARWTDDNFGTAIELAMQHINQLAEKEELVVHQQALASICHRIANIIEDGRIELKDSKENPGFDRSRNYFRGKLWEWAYLDFINHGITPYNKMQAGEKMNHILNNLLTLATMYELPASGKKATAGCYNKGWLDLYRNTDMHDTIKACKPWLMTGVNGTVCADIVVPTVKIAESLWVYMRECICIGKEDFQAIQQLIEQLEKMMEDEQNMGKAKPITSKPSTKKEEESDNSDNSDNSESGEGASDNSEDSDDSESGEGASDSSEDSDDSESGEGESDNSEDSDDSESGEGESDSSDDSCGFDFDSIPDCIEDGDEERFDADQQQVAKNNISNQAAEEQADKDRMMERDETSLEDALAGFYNEDNYCTSFREVMANRNQIHTITNEARIQGNKLKRFFDNYLRNKSTPNRTNLVSGKVNTSQITKVCIGEQNYFKQMGVPWKPDCSFYILLDDSGSMNGSKREYAARQCSALEFGIPTSVPFKITAFDTEFLDDSWDDYGVRHRVIKDWNDTKKGNQSYSESWLHNEYCGGGNKDGYSIRVATHELLQRQEKKKMLIVLSDGEPTEYEGGEAQGYNDVRNAVEHARKSGIDVVAIFFGDNEFLRDSKQFYDHMYQKDYIGVNPENIFPELEKVLKKLLK